MTSHCPACRGTASFLINESQRKCCSCGAIYLASETIKTSQVIMNEIWIDHDCIITKPDGIKVSGSIARLSSGQYYFRPDYERPPWTEVSRNNIIKCEHLREELVKSKLRSLSKSIEDMSLTELVKDDPASS